VVKIKQLYIKGCDFTVEVGDFDTILSIKTNDDIADCISPYIYDKILEAISMPRCNHDL
jgi:hypothetical protein